jgi:hypothetical protein
MRKLISLIAIIIVSSLCWGSSVGDYDAWKVSQQPGEPSLSYTSSVSAIVGVNVNDADGTFTIGTADGARLLYGHGSDPWSTLFNFRVDGVEYLQTDLNMDTAPSLDGATISCSYLLDDYRIWQYVTPIDFNAEEGSVKIEYVIENNDGAVHDLDLLLEMDTMVSNNDAAPISTEFGYTGVETCYDAPDIPDYWQAFEVDPTQDPEFLIGQGTLNGYDATPPARFAVGAWGSFYEPSFDYICSGDSYGDSATLLWWYNNIAAGGTATLITYYGIGTVSQSPGELSLTLSGPNELTCDNFGNLVPNPFSANLIVTNTGSTPCEDVWASISLPVGLTATTADFELGDIAPDDFATASFEITASGNPCNLTLDYYCTVTSETCAENSVSDYIYIPCCDYLEIEPAEFALQQNYPNPFNPSTTIVYSLAVPVPVQIQVIGLTGNLIATLVDEQGTVGVHEVEFKAVNLPSGIYFYKLTAGDYTVTRKMVLVR